MRPKLLSNLIILNGFELVDDLIKDWMKTPFISIGVVEHLTEPIHIFMGVKVEVVDLTLGVVKTIGIRFPVENRGLVKSLERLPDFFGFVNEIKCEGMCLTRSGSVKTRKGLYTLNTP